MIIFKIKSLTVKIQFLFVAIICIFLITDNTQVGILVFLACIIHETAHMIMFVLLGYVPKELSFEITGMKIVESDENIPFIKELLIQSAGSAANILIFLILLQFGMDATLRSIFAVSHLMVGTFNLLPMKNFDGGKIIGIILDKLIGNEKSTVVCSTINKIMLAFLCLAGLLLFIFVNRSFTLCILTIYLLISLFINV